LDWNTLDRSLTSAFVHLMSLPTINHIDLSYIRNFPLSSLTSSVNLLRLDILRLTHFGFFDYHKEDNFFKTVQSEMMPKIREFNTSGSSLQTIRLLDVKGQDGRPAFNFMDLRQLSVSFVYFEERRSVQYLLENAKLLERLHLSVACRLSIVGVLSSGARTLNVLDLTVSLYHHVVHPLAGLCEELEAMAGHNALEAISCNIRVDSHHDTEDSIGSAIRKVENILVKPGWSALRQVSFKLLVDRPVGSAELTEALQSLPDKYLSHLPKLDSVAFNYSAYAV